VVHDAARRGAVGCPGTGDGCIAPGRAAAFERGLKVFGLPQKPLAPPGRLPGPFHGLHLPSAPLGPAGMLGDRHLSPPLRAAIRIASWLRMAAVTLAGCEGRRDGLYLQLVRSPAGPGSAALTDHFLAFSPPVVWFTLNSAGGL
jgi:hypothetical protein